MCFGAGTRVRVLLLPIAEGQDAMWQLLTATARPGKRRAGACGVRPALNGDGDDDLTVTNTPSHRKQVKGQVTVKQPRVSEKVHQWAHKVH